MTNTSTWVVPVIEDGDDIVLPFPDGLLGNQGWQEGDTLEWIDNNDGSWTIRKSDETA